MVGPAGRSTVKVSAAAQLGTPEGMAADASATLEMPCSALGKVSVKSAGEGALPPGFTASRSLERTT